MIVCNIAKMHVTYILEKQLGNTLFFLSCSTFSYFIQYYITQKIYKQSSKIKQLKMKLLGPCEHTELGMQLNEFSS